MSGLPGPAPKEVVELVARALRGGKDDDGSDHDEAIYMDAEHFVNALRAGGLSIMGIPNTIWAKVLADQDRLEAENQKLREERDRLLNVEVWEALLPIMGPFTMNTDSDEVRRVRANFQELARSAALVGEGDQERVEDAQLGSMEQLDEVSKLGIRSLPVDREERVGERFKKCDRCNGTTRITRRVAPAQWDWAPCPDCNVVWQCSRCGRTADTSRELDRQPCASCERCKGTGDRACVEPGDVLYEANCPDCGGTGKA